jgi:hypothetical protein
MSKNDEQKESPNKESEEGLFNTNYEKLQGWLILIRTGKF